MAAFLKKNQTSLILTGILLLAFLVRWWGIGYGLPNIRCRPDEDRLIKTALRLSWEDPDPHYFIWPSLSFYLTRLILEGERMVLKLSGRGSHLSSLQFYYFKPTYFQLLLRYLFCVMGVATVFFLYRLGRRLFSPRAGLLAAFFLSLTFLHARDSHFAMLDIPATLLAVIFFLQLPKVRERGEWRDYLRAAIFAGLAVATKYYSIILVFPLLVAYRARSNSDLPSRGRYLLGALLLIGLIPLLTSPYLLLDFASFRRDLTSGIIANQYISGFNLLPDLGTPRGWIYHLTFSLRYGLGWPLEVVSLLGVIYALRQAVRKEFASSLLLSFIIPFYLLLSFEKACFIRYTMLLLPFLCLLAARFLEALWRWTRLKIWFLVLAVLLIVSDSSYRLIRHDLLLSREDSRNLTSEWMKAHLPLDSHLFLPQYYIFGRPEACRLYGKRFSLPRGIKAEELTELLPLAARGVDYEIINESPLPYSHLDPGVIKLLQGQGDLVYRLDAYSPSARPVYDLFDAYYVPLAGFEGVKRTGPNIRIYRVK